MLEYTQEWAGIGDHHRGWGRCGELERKAGDGGFDVEEEVRNCVGFVVVVSLTVIHADLVSSRLRYRMGEKRSCYPRRIFAD